MKINVLIDTLKRILNRVVNSPVTPVVSLVLFLSLEEYIQRDGETWLRCVEVFLSLLGMIAVIRCYRHKWVRRISLGLLALVMLFNINEIRLDCEPSPARTVNVSSAMSRSSAGTQNAGGFLDDLGFGSQTCVYCSGTGYCHICHGDGYQDCGSCMNGSCPVCLGTGDHGSCSFCYGTGFCRTCNGNGKTMCNWCFGTGTCDHCHGTGEK